MEGDGKLMHMAQHPELWGAKAFIPKRRPGAPGFIFTIQNSSISPVNRYAELKLQYEGDLKRYKLDTGDVIWSEPTGVMVRVVGRMGKRRLKIEALMLPDPDDFALGWFLSKQLKGRAAVLGFMVMEDEPIPAWTGIKEVEVQEAFNQEGFARNDYLEAFHDVNPGVRKGNKPWMGQNLKSEQEMQKAPTGKDLVLWIARKKAMERAIQEGEGKMMDEKLDRPLEKHQDFRVTELIPEKDVLKELDKLDSKGNPK